MADSAAMGHPAGPFLRPPVHTIIAMIVDALCDE